MEKVYENALAHEMRKSGMTVVKQRRIVVRYDDVVVGEVTAVPTIGDQVIGEGKVIRAMSDVHIPQCRNDLRATGNPLRLLINFGWPKIEIRRVTARS